MNCIEKKWTILNTGVSSAEENMQIDTKLLEELNEHSAPVLHLYDWKGDCATYGYFVDPFDFLSREGVEKREVHLARRPTGGGIIFHIWDFAFSVAVPSHSRHFSQNTLDNYEFVNSAVLQAAKEFLQTNEPLEIIPDDFAAKDAASKRFCMAQPTKYDVILQGKKIAGAAQRKTKQGFLHQGTISLMMPPKDYLEDVLLPHTEVLEALFANTFPLMGTQAEKKELDSARKHIQELLIKYLTKES